MDISKVKGVFDPEEVEFTAFENKKKIGIITKHHSQFKFESYVMWEIKDRVFKNEILVFDGYGNLLIIIDTSDLSQNGIYRIKYTCSEDEVRGLLLITAIDVESHSNNGG